MTTNVNFFAPYIVNGKAIRVRAVSPQARSSGGEHVISEEVVTKANEVHSIVIHSHATLEIAEIDATEPAT